MNRYYKKKFGSRSLSRIYRITPISGEIHFPKDIPRFPSNIQLLISAHYFRPLRRAELRARRRRRGRRAGAAVAVPAGRAGQRRARHLLGGKPRGAGLRPRPV